jgi:hypothetical protein
MHAFSSILCFFQKMSATLSLFNFIQATPSLPWCEKRSGQRLWSYGAPYSATCCLSLGLCRISSMSILMKFSIGNNQFFLESNLKTYRVLLHVVSQHLSIQRPRVGLDTQDFKYKARGEGSAQINDIKYYLHSLFKSNCNHRGYEI